MFFWLWLLSIVLSMLVMTGRPYRWLRNQHLGRHPAALAQTLVLAALWFWLWVSFIPSPNAARDQLVLYFVSMFLVIYAGILLRIRQLRLL